MEKQIALIRHELKSARRADNGRRMSTLEKKLAKLTIKAWRATRSPNGWQVTPISDKTWIHDAYRSHRYMLRDGNMLTQVIQQTWEYKEIWVDWRSLAMGQTDAYGQDGEIGVFSDLEQALAWAKSKERGPLVADWKANVLDFELNGTLRPLAEPQDPRLDEFPQGRAAALELCAAHARMVAYEKSHRKARNPDYDHGLWLRIHDEVYTRLEEFRRATAAAYAVLAYDYGASEIVPVSPFCDDNHARLIVSEHYYACLGFMINHYGNLIVVEPTGVMSDRRTMGGFDQDVELRVWDNVKVRIFRTLEQALAWHAGNQVAALYMPLHERPKYYGHTTSFENLGRPLALLGP